jgi:DNA-binding response OmpR family regulator
MPARILIVDDEPHVAQLIERYLSPEGYECAIAGSGEEAMALLHQDRFDLVITDIMMPGMSGMDLLNVANRLQAPMPVLLVTAVDDRDTGMAALQLGAAGFVIKPFKQNDILFNVARALMTGRPPDAETGASHVPAGAPSETARDQSSGAPQRIVADEAVGLITSGTSDSELMQRFNLSSDGLARLLDELVARGKLSPKDVEQRRSLSPESVTLDVSRTAPKSGAKPLIKASEAAQCVKSGMDDVDIMNRYGLSAKGLRSLYQKLVDSGLVNPEDFYLHSTSPATFQLVDDVRSMPRRHLAVAAEIYEPSRPHIVGLLSDITEAGVGTEGIAAEVGRIKEFIIPTRGMVPYEDIRVRAKCLWSEAASTEAEAIAGFQIVQITPAHLAGLRALIKYLAFVDT